MDRGWFQQAPYPRLRWLSTGLKRIVIGHAQISTMAEGAPVTRRRSQATTEGEAQAVDH